ncbi:hypothetical protein HN51_059346 [Arachis hypogaea]|uniref:Root meristem growth factor n=1 Tax=Arachis hypogaea TaxID=3818 RepID=A0A444X531_ARAHY|nr:uncharacterized protein LOC107622066 [Arachis ipaensis]XP_025683482.1 uncharacterized protein LOC112784472 [Arachis hypogaea]QHN82748.1 uncharacterized protein DS421_20g698490 [Arachis hypogaea]RYQ84797.1 hypothetical protein Ahy_B10g104272 [Arachis hypogaea]
MAALESKRVLLAVLVLLCFFSIQARARTLKEISKLTNRGDHHGNSDAHDNKEAHNSKFKSEEHNHDEVNGGSEVFSMDYTPASRKPPIHN